MRQTTLQPLRMLRTKLGLLAAALLLGPAATGLAEDLHVATTGSDWSAGSATAPFRTIRQGLEVAGPGDTLYLHAGTYAEEVSSYAGRIRGGESWANALIIAAFPGDTVVLEPPSGSDRVVTLADASASYIVIRGIVMDARNVRYEGVKITWSSPDPANSSHHIRIEDSEVINAPGQGVLVAGHHNELLRLRVHGNGLSDFDHGIYISSPDNLVDGCEVYQNAGWGVHVYNGEATDADRNTVRNNRIHDNARVGRRGAGIVLSSGEDNIAYNNIIFGNKHGIQVDLNAVRSRLYNNTLFAQGNDGILVGAGATDTDIRNNLLFDNSAGITNTGIRTSSGANLVTHDPGVVDAARFDVHLLASSPAIDGGEALAAVPFDFDHVPRPEGGGYDIGACEFRNYLTPGLRLTPSTFGIGQAVALPLSPANGSPEPSNSSSSTPPTFR
jgi:parallel beta-helix repeat protein